MWNNTGNKQRTRNVKHIASLVKAVEIMRISYDERAVEIDTAVKKMGLPRTPDGCLRSSLRFNKNTAQLFDPIVCAFFELLLIKLLRLIACYQSSTRFVSFCLLKKKQPVIGKRISEEKRMGKKVT